ncbi:MAG: HAD family hydrolase, partial [Campylobacterales bacterium]|nr:HAD family hydrolase [Campylobacterales bacterium]
EVHYLHKIEDFEFQEGVFETCQYFQSLGYLIVVITNQAGIAKGYFSNEDFQLLTDWMVKAFAKEGIDIAKVYYCPHHPDFTGACDCRKPKAGMILEAQKAFDIDLANSFLVGDKMSDIEAGQNAGIGECYLISTGHDISAIDYAKKIDNLQELMRFNNGVLYRFQ